jgi:TP901 family phage tail tape measure protein
MPVNVGTLLVDVRFNTAGLGRKLSEELGAAGGAAGRALDQSLSARLTRLGTSLGNTGRQLSLGLTLPIVAFGRQAANAFIGFDRAMTQISSLVGVNRNQVDAWRGQVIEMGKAWGVSAEATAQALYFITSSGIEAADAMGVLDIAVKGQAIGLGTAQQNADIVTSAINAYGKENITAAKAADVLTVAVREGKGEADKLGGALSAVIPIASSVGVSFGEVAGAMSAMTLSGTTPDEAATQLRGILNTLQDMPPIAQRALKAYTGLDYATVRANLSSKGLIPTLKDITDAFKGNEAATAEVFGNVRALTGVYNLFGAKTAQTLAIVEQTTNANGDFNRSIEATADSAALKYERAMTDISAAMTEIGATILPIVSGIGTAFGSVLGSIAKLPPALGTPIAGLATLVAFAGPLTYMGGSFLRLAGGVAALNTQLFTANGLTARLLFSSSAMAVAFGHVLAAARGAFAYIIANIAIIAAAFAAAMVTVYAFNKAIHYTDEAFQGLEGTAKRNNLNVTSWDELQGRIKTANEGIGDYQRQIEELENSPLSLTPGGVQELQQLRNAGAVFQAMGEDAQRLSDQAATLSDKFKIGKNEATAWIVAQAKLGTTFETSETAAAAYEASLRSLGTAAAGVGGFPALIAAVKETSDAFFSVVNAEKAYADSRKAIADASEKVKEAERGVTDALRQEETAKKRVGDADRKLAESGRKLADARLAAADAQKALQDALAGPSVDEQINVESARLALEEARLRARAPGQTSLEKRRSALDVRRAEQDLKDAQAAHDERVADARKDVASATEAVASAESAQRDAAEAAIEARRGLAEAEDKVAEARRGVGQAIDGVKEAEENALQPALNLANAQAILGTMFATNTSEGAKFREFLIKLKDLYPELGAQIDILMGKYAALDTSIGKPGNMKGGFQSERAIEGRATGGPVTPKRLYEVNETGMPELYSQGTRQYLIPLGAGKVTPMTDLPVAGGDGVSYGDINVYEVSGKPRQTAYEVRRELRKDSYLTGRRG